MTPRLNQLSFDEVGNHDSQKLPDSQPRQTLIDYLNSFASHLPHFGAAVAFFIEDSFTPQKENPNDKVESRKSIEWVPPDGPLEKFPPHLNELYGTNHED